MGKWGPRQVHFSDTLKNLTREVANILSKFEGTIYFRMKDSLDVEVAKELSLFAGEKMIIGAPIVFAEAREALEANELIQLGP